MNLVFGVPRLRGPDRLKAELQTQVCRRALVGKQAHRPVFPPGLRRR
jgi:hypothetical protein